MLGLQRSSQTPAGVVCGVKICRDLRSVGPGALTVAAEVGRPQARKRLLCHHPVVPPVVEAEDIPPRSGRLHGDPGDAHHDVRPLVDLLGIGDGRLPADHAELQAFDRADLFKNGQRPTLAVRDEGDPLWSGAQFPHRLKVREVDGVADQGCGKRNAPRDRFGHPDVRVGAENRDFFIREDAMAGEDALSDLRVSQCLHARPMVDECHVVEE